MWFFRGWGQEQKSASKESSGLEISVGSARYKQSEQSHRQTQLSDACPKRLGLCQSLGLYNQHPVG